MPQICHFPGVNSVTNIEPDKGVMPVAIVKNIHLNGSGSDPSIVLKGLSPCMSAISTQLRVKFEPAAKHQGHQQQLKNTAAAIKGSMPNLLLVNTSRARLDSASINRPKAILDMISYPSLNVLSEYPASPCRGLVGDGLIDSQARCHTAGLCHYRNL